MFKKILIANRGEIAVRVIRACRDLGIVPIAVCSEADRNALHVRLADEVYCLGPAPSLQSYLRIDKVIEAARKSGADAIHPGYGFLAENAAFAAACAEHGIVFIGPGPEAIRQMGGKIESRHIAARAGVAIVPGSDGPVTSKSEALSVANEIGYPILIKASSGGGGKGMRVVWDPKDLPSAFETASGEAASAFNDATVYIEKYVQTPRHIEVQVLADHFGNAVHLGERECSIQRRHQKLVEESPSPVVNPELRKFLGDQALAIVDAVGYRNAGTVEFLVDATGSLQEWRFYFLEMNTRLQVEHPVTEMITGVDLVREQILVASGQRLGFSQEEVRFRGAAIECRVYAEDPGQNFLPSPGVITSLMEPSGPGIRNDSGVYAGFTIPFEYDPMISKLVAHGPSREVAIARMQRALLEYQIGGVSTTIPFFQNLLNHPAFLAGDLDTHFIEKHGLLEAQSPAESDLAKVAALAAVERFLSAPRNPQSQQRTTGRWKDYSRRQWH